MDDRRRNQIRSEIHRSFFPLTFIHLKNRSISPVSRMPEITLQILPLRSDFRTSM
jgi:hypothetical protein